MKRASSLISLPIIITQVAGNQVYSKLGVRSRVQAMVRARELHFLTSSTNAPPVTQVPTEDFQPNNPYGRLLTSKAYETIGGTVGALARRADDLYPNFDMPDYEVIQQMFLRLDITQTATYALVDITYFDEPHNVLCFKTVIPTCICFANSRQGKLRQFSNVSTIGRSLNGNEVTMRSPKTVRGTRRTVNSSASGKITILHEPRRLCRGFSN